MATTAGTLIDETIEHLQSGARNELNTLAAAVDTDDTILSFTYPLNGIRPGARLAVDLELFDVVATSGQTATVIRAAGGSTAASHAENARVVVNPVFSRFAVFRELNNELAALSAKGLFAARTVDLTYQASIQGYNLTSVTSAEKILEVRAQRSGSDKRWDTVARNRWELQRNADTNVFASGFCLQLLDGDPGRKVRVTYAGVFGALTSEASDPNDATVGFPATANDILPMGAAIRLALPREVARNVFEAQGEPRRATEVPPGAQVQSALALKRLYDERVREEANRLMRRYPRRKWA